MWFAESSAGFRRKSIRSGGNESVNDIEAIEKGIRFLDEPMDKGKRTARAIHGEDPDFSKLTPTQLREKWQTLRVCQGELELENKELRRTTAALEEVISKHKAIEAALQKANNELEEKVWKRTDELRFSNRDLKNITSELEESNTALRVVLRNLESEKKAFEDKVVSNIRDLLLPFINKLKKSDLRSDQRAQLDLIETNLSEMIASSFSRKLTANHVQLTAKEVFVANMVRQGKKSEDIAEAMGVTRKTVEYHRNNLRKKLGLQNKKANLRSFLSTIE